MKQLMLLAVAAAFLGGCASVASEPVVVAPAAEPVAPAAESVVVAPVASPVEDVSVQPEPVETEIPVAATEAGQTQGEVAGQAAALGHAAAQCEFSLIIHGSGRVLSYCTFYGSS